MRGLRSPWPTSLPIWMCACGLRVLFIRLTDLVSRCSPHIPMGEASRGHGDDGCQVGEM